MRLGLLGLGRIGAFHAETLTSLPVVEELVVADLAADLGPGLPLRSAEPGVSFPDGKPFTFFMDRLASAFRAELTAFTEVVAG